VGPYSTNSATASLTLGTAKNLVWAGTDTKWDLNTTADWLDSVNPATFNYGDAVTFDDTASLRTVRMIDKYLSASSVTVQGNAAYTFAANSTGGFAGPGKLIYTGGNSLLIANANTYSGGTIVSNSSAYLIVSNYAGLGTGPVILAQAGGQMEVGVAGSATVGIPGDIIVEDDFAITYDMTDAFGLVLLGNLSGTNGKTLTLHTLATTNVSRVRLYGGNTTCDANIELSEDKVLFASYNGTGEQVFNGIISGNGSFMEKGTETILNGANTYSGGTTPAQGVIGLGIDSVGSPTVTSGPIGTGPLYLAPDSTTSLTGTGWLLASGGARTIANPIQYRSGTNNLTLALGGTNALTLSGPITLGGNDGLGGPTNRIFQVTNTALTTFSGVISDAAPGFGLVKTGNGTLALNGIETYTGPTLISNGVLQVNGSLPASSAVTVASNGTLGGTGTINGVLTVLSGGALAPGDSIGTLTINNNLSLAGNLNIEVNKSGSPTSDQIIVSGTVNNTGIGTITVTNLGPALAQGDSFTLFNKPVSGGGSLAITGGGANVTWTNKLAVDGSIAVASVVSTTRTNITISVSGNNLTLGWPADHTGWALQAQTNAPGQGLGTNWATVPGSTGVNQVVMPINPANGSVFFRLVSP
jgi:autotransporter-associated beta strand protein